MRKFAMGSLLAATMLSGNPAAAAPQTTDWHDWRGLYVGGDAGYGWGSDKTGFNPLPTPATFINLKPSTLNPNPDGIIFGPHAGYNWQKNRLVFGTELDFSFTDVAGSTSSTPLIQNNGTPFPGAAFISASQRNLWLSTLRGRVGYTPCEHALIYATGGLAVGEDHYKAITDFHPVGTTIYQADFNKTQVGWIAGAGAEYALSKNWSVKAEYLYYDLGNTSFTANASPLLPPFQVHYNFQSGTNIVHVGFSYKFD